METLKEKLKYNQRIGLLLITLFFFWVKTILAYYTEFSLGVQGLFQTVILWLNPIPLGMILLSLSLYFKEKKNALRGLLIIYFLMSVLLYSNILYYREFADFLTMSTILSNMGGENSILSGGGVIEGVFAMIRIWDILYWVDIIGLAWLMNKIIKQDEEKIITEKPFYKRYAFAGTIAGVAVLFGNLMLAETDRPQLLTRTFDRNYIVKYLGVNFFAGYDSLQTMKNNRVRAQADEGDLTDVYNFAQETYAAPNDAYYGIAEGRNVITIVLESASSM